MINNNAKSPAYALSYGYSMPPNDAINFVVLGFSLGTEYTLKLILFLLENGITK